MLRSELRTLFVCYNKQLAEALHEKVADSLERDCLEFLDIRHFHGLAKELVDAAGLNFTVPDAVSERDGFWRDDVPDLLEQAVTVLAGERPVQYAAVVVDEGQDFHPSWWECLDYALLERSGSGPFYAFADPDQSLWDWSVSEPPIPFDTVYRLRRNCRNTRLIGRKYSASLAAVDSDFLPRSPVGTEPIVSSPPRGQKR